MTEAGLQEKMLYGLDAVTAVTMLLQRIRNEHPTAGLYEAAELQWFWSSPRSTDELGQLFWFDDTGVPAAAAILTDWGSGLSLLYEDTTLVVVALPDATPLWISHMVDRALEHATGAGIETLALEVDRADDVMRTLLIDRGFSFKEDGIVVCWLDSELRPEVSPLPAGYRLLSRQETAGAGWPHHMANPRRPDFEERLDQLSLYRPDLDLVVVDTADEYAAYALFWNDPDTATGAIEPVRTLDDHRRLGLARHILTAGIDLLARAGAGRINIGYEPDNPASGHLYRSIGFEPDLRTDMFSRSRT